MPLSHQMVVQLCAHVLILRVFNIDNQDFAFKNNDLKKPEEKHNGLKEPVEKHHTTPK